MITSILFCPPYKTLNCGKSWMITKSGLSWRSPRNCGIYHRILNLRRRMIIFMPRTLCLLNLSGNSFECSPDKKMCRSQNQTGCGGITTPDVLPGIETVFPGRSQLAWRRELLRSHTACRYTKFGIIQRDSKRGTQFRTSIFPELYMVCEWST
jgi:hypothetical protein